MVHSVGLLQVSLLSDSNQDPGADHLRPERNIKVGKDCIGTKSAHLPLPMIDDIENFCCPVVDLLSICYHTSQPVSCSCINTIITKMLILLDVVS